MKINSEIISAVIFMLTLGSVVALQFAASHPSATLMYALFSIMGISAGHAMGHSASSGTSVAVSLPGNTSGGKDA